MTNIIHRYRIMLSPQVAMLIKVLVTLEGTVKLLSPKFSLMEVMQPFQKQMLLRRLSPARQIRKMRRLWVELEHLAEVVPQQVTRILEQVQAGKFDVHLDHRGLGPSVNRLVLGMLASALFLGSSWMLANRVEPMLFPKELFGYDLTIEGWIPRPSLLGLLGCITSILVGFRLLWAIGKSGHLDQKKSK
jgi:ubiquinone biosynthesis protein